MVTLFERLKNMKEGSPDINQPRQKKIQDVLRTKGGKADIGTGIAQTGLAEAATMQQGQQALREGATRGAIQQAGTDIAQQAQQQQIDLQQAGLQQQADLARQAGTQRELGARQTRLAGEEDFATRDQARRDQQILDLNDSATRRLRDLAASRRISVDDLFSNFKRDNRNLEDRKDAAQLEQLAFMLALQDKQYLDELERIGRERGLKSDVAFEQEQNRLIYGEELDRLLDELDFNRGQNVSDRDFAKELAQMNNQAAIQMAQSILADSQRRAMWEAGGTIAGTVAGEYGKRSGGGTAGTDAEFREDYGVSPQGRLDFGGPR